MRLIGMRHSAIGAALLLTTGLVAMSAQAQGDGGGGSPSQAPSQTDNAPTAGDFPCPTSPPDGVGTCVQVWNQWSQSLTSPIITPDQGTTVKQAPPKEIPPNQNGVWVTVGNKLGDGARVVFNLPAGHSTVSYATQTNKALMTVDGVGDPPYYCTISSSRQGGWLFVRIKYTDVKNDTPGKCSMGVPASAEGTGPATPVPSPTPQP